MKKSLFMVMAILSIGGITGVHAQRCGTSEYYNLKTRADHQVQQRMDDFEKVSQQWIISNQRNLQAKTTSYPFLAGFTATGIEASDRLNYQTAKQDYLKSKPVKNTTTVSANAVNTEMKREHKRNVNVFKSAEGGINK